MNPRLKSIASACVTATLLLVSYSLLLQPSVPSEGTLVRSTVSLQAAATDDRTPIAQFIALLDSDPSIGLKALTNIRQGWTDGDAVMLLEAARFNRTPVMRRSIMKALSEMAAQPYDQTNEWYDWIWNHTNDPHPRYAAFKKDLYRRIDSRFAEHFDVAFDSSIRLDEIRWGGVRRDGIPPLKTPATVAAHKADYLADSDVVFGVQFEGHARAYPKRILAWHEMVKDTVGGKMINGVYCTLCGSMIVYDTELDGKNYELGTSGFLYRSNKLMYDHKTKSMWSTLKGAPVVGPLVGKGLKLRPLYVVTTTWGKWKTDHPETDVLTLETGHRRDYGEGVAYRDYFATDNLMFTVPKIDTRLKNKSEVFALRLGNERTVAFATSFLNAHRVHHETVGERDAVILTDESGANRAYETKGQTFDRWINSDTIVDTQGRRWKIAEDSLTANETSARDGDGDKVLRRLPAHRAFWFGWHSAFPQTRLVK